MLRVALAEQGLVGVRVGRHLEIVGGPARPVGDVEAVEPDALEHAEFGEHAVHAASGREVSRLVQRDVEVVDDLRAAHLAEEVVGVAAREHVLLEHEHAQPRLRHPRRRGEPAESGPDDDYVPVRVDSCHVGFPSSPPSLPPSGSPSRTASASSHHAMCAARSRSPKRSVRSQ